MNLLLVAYFYPPCRDTGAHRPAAMAKWLRRLGHRVTVLTTSAYGIAERRRRGRRRAHDRPPAPARAPARPRSRRRPVRLRHLLGQAPPPEQGARARAAGRRLGAVCAVARPAAEPPRALRLRDHQLAARVGPRRRPGAGAARRPLGRRPPRRLDLRADPPALPHRPPAPPRRAPGKTLAGLGRRGRLRQPAGRRRPAHAPRDRAAARPQRLGPRPGRARTGGRRRRGHPGPRAPLARLHGSLRQLRARPQARWSKPWASWPEPTPPSPPGSSWWSRVP